MKDVSLLNESSNPLYRQLMSHLRSDIASGKFPVGSKIPSEKELGDMYKVSRVTVRKALAELTREGLLKAHQGKGTYVDTPRLCRDMKNVNSFHDACRIMNRTPGAKIIRQQLVLADDEDSAKLDVPIGSSIVEIVRIRTADEEPVMVECNHFPIEYSYLLNENLTESLYNILSKHNVEVGSGSHEISLNYASASEARLLEIEPGTALLKLDEVIFDTEGNPLHTSSQVIRGDRFTFRI